MHPLLPIGTEIVGNHVQSRTSKLPLTLIRVSKRYRTLSISINSGIKVSVASRGASIDTKLHIHPPNKLFLSLFLLLLSFTLHKCLFCWQLIYHHPRPLTRPKLRLTIEKKLHPDKPQDYSSWLLFPEESLHSFYLKNGHYTTTILSVTKKRHLSESETDLTCMHSYIAKHCKQCRLSSRHE